LTAITPQSVSIIKENRMNFYHLLQTVNIANVKDLGRCPRCMRKSFIAAAAALASLVLASQWLREAHLMIPLGVLTAALIVLWIAHLVMFSFRQVLSGKASDADEQPDSARRAFLPTVAKVLAGALVWTALPQLARAKDSCDQCHDDRNQCMNGCGNVSNNPDPQAHREWSRCRRQCRQDYDCTDPCEHPSDSTDRPSDDGKR
jgi:hypothetical protein